jgi:ribosomal protein L11 methyltransferase
MCLEKLEAVLTAGMDVLDVGCGSGILSIAAAKLGARNVFGIEIDSVAVRVAKQNMRDNGIDHTVRVVEGSLPNDEVHPDSYDIAIANISAKIVTEIANEMVRSVRPGGHIIASGILVENMNSVIDALNLAGSELIDTVVDGDWVALVASVS